MKKTKLLSSKGFTLIELMIVILIISILLVLASFSYRRIRERVRYTSCRANMRTIHNASLKVQAEIADPNFDITVTNLVEMGYLRRRPECPSGGRYQVVGERYNLTVRCVGREDGSEHGQISEYEEEEE